MNPLAYALMSGNPQMAAMGRGGADPRLAAALAGPKPASQTATTFAAPPAQAPRPVVSVGPKTDSLARALMGGATASAPQTPFEALGKLAQLWSGNRQQEKFIEAEAARAEAAKQADEQEMMGKLAKFQELVNSGVSPQEAALQTGVGAEEAIGSYFKDPAKRDTYKDANDVTRYADTGEPLPGQSAMAGPDTPAPMFPGKGTDAVALNYLIETGKLTREDAANVAAGKTVTDPATGIIYFKTPEGLINQKAPEAAIPGPVAEAAPVQQPGAINADPHSVPLTGPRERTSEQIKGDAILAKAQTDIDSGIADKVYENPGFWSSLGSDIGGPVGAVMQSGEYQAGEDAIRNIIAASLYATSGATANPGEVKDAMSGVMPSVTDTAERRAAKRARMKGYTDVLMARANKPAAQKPPPTASSLRDKYGLE